MTSRGGDAPSVESVNLVILSVREKSPWSSKEERYSVRGFCCPGETRYCWSQMSIAGRNHDLLDSIKGGSELWKNRKMRTVNW